MKINVFIPHEPGNKLGEAYNRLMDESSTDWNLFIDRDILILNPNWYDICLNAIDKCGKSAGWITCLTNRIGCHHQRYNVENSDDIKYHLQIANKLYNQNKGNIIEPADYAPFSGHFILTHKEAWEKAGKFDNGWGCDNNFDKSLRENNYKRFVMTDLYVYHMYTIKGLWK